MNALQRHLGDRFSALDPLIQKAHIGITRLRGNVRVRRGNAIASLLCTLLRFPPANDSCPLDVIADHREQEMIWQRDFDGKKMTSHFRLRGPYLQESLGLTRLLMMLSVDNGRLTYQLMHSRVMGIPIPRWLAPGLLAYEQEYASLYDFCVEVSLPVIGRLIRYEGKLQLVDTGATS